MVRSPLRLLCLCAGHFLPLPSTMEAEGKRPCAKHRKSKQGLRALFATVTTPES